MSWAASLLAEAERRRRVQTERDPQVERIARLAARRATPLPVRLTWTCMAHDARRRPCRIRTNGGRLCGVHQFQIERRAQR